MEIEASIAEYIGNLSVHSPEDIKEDTLLREVLGPTDLAALIIMCEEEYTLDIPDELVHELITVYDLADYMRTIIDTREELAARRARFGEDE